MLLPLDQNGHPIQGRYIDLYGLANTDTTGSPTEYYGHTASDGSWYIMKLVTGTSGSATYAKGTSDYATNRTNRASLTYETYSTTFGLT